MNDAPLHSAASRTARASATAAPATADDATVTLPGPRQVRRAIVVSVLGNGLEWFDFLTYAYFSKTIAHVFFPTGNPVVSLSLTFATFALGFLVRPLGGIILGRYADRVGRTPALALLMMLMSGSTLLMGLVPGYATIGIAAPLLVVLARLIQGLAVGGQFGTTSALLVEFAPPGKKMFYGSFNMSSQALALLLSSGCGYLLSSLLHPDQLTSWGWRVPFLIGWLIGPLGLYIRRRVDESPEFEALHRRVEARRAAGTAPARQGAMAFIREHGDAALCAMGVIIVGAAPNYLWHSYLPVFVERQLHLPLESALLGAFVSGAINLVLFPISGRIADRFGAYRLFFPLIIVWALACYPLFWFVVAHPSREHLFIAQMIASVFMAAMSGPHPGMLATIFPVEARSTGVAVSYNIAVTLAGGLAPLTVTTLTQLTGSNLVSAFYMIGAAVISLLLVRFTRTGRAALAADRQRARARLPATHATLTQ